MLHEQVESLLSAACGNSRYVDLLARSMFLTTTQFDRQLYMNSTEGGSPKNKRYKSRAGGSTL